MPIAAVTSQQMPAIRTRNRALALDAPVNSPLNDAASNEVQLKAKLTPLLQAYATANRKKNDGTNEERKAKDNLNVALIEENLTQFDAVVDVNGDKVHFEAKIAEADAKEISIEKVMKLVGVKITGNKDDVEKFMKLIAVTQTRMEETLGKNSVIACQVPVKKPAALSVGKKAKAN
ncbi:hypothetical protein J2J97_31920 (plasmid) [Rhizobium bangladeshense]|uniref:hypothetical protein n=1 Tax=Rhizobium bangladeshense TaxID=1138189 RepID=UPI001A98861C|nr:hypothetical protein [Rhizobium bangladeshense]QSY98680.1 hypothetical protein J2J97_31920 [Rhizobium bangladeshense]